jgi:MiaB/RimO family radical SAM methylthiotransferase
VKLKIFWCKVNKYYTDKWMNSEYLRDKSWVFIATCVVTDKAKKKWLKFVKDEVKNLKKSEKVYLSWCWVLINWKIQTNFYELYPELKEYEKVIEILGEKPINESPHPNPLPKWEGTWKKINLPKNLFTKKFVLIQSWCDNYCTFCLTILKRWKHFFRKKEEILKDIIEFEKDWWKEIVLTWINLWAWGLKNTNDYKKSKFDELLKYILENSKISRIRISSLWPEFINDKCLVLFENKRINPHFHFSIQSWSTNILKKMNRNYNWDYVKNILIKTKNIQRNDNVSVSLWADIIVWFPWETVKDFEDTYNLVKDVEIQKVHAFTFSAHKIWETVPAWSFPNKIDEKTKKERLKKLNDLSEKIRENFISFQKWKIFEVLIESTKNWNFKGWTKNYIEANQENFEIISWNIKRKEVVIWRLR